MVAELVAERTDLLDLSVVIPTHSQPELLPRAVESCVREIQAAGIRGEVMVVDNASTDGAPRRVADRFPEVHLIRNDVNRSFSAASNQGIRASRGRLILLLNDDAVLQPGSLGLMMEALEAEAAIAAVGPKLISPDGSVQWYNTNCRFPRLYCMLLGWLGLTLFLRRRAWTRDLLTNYRDEEHGGETDWIGGACLLARRRDLEQIGFLDESYYYGAEDVDLCYRFHRAGRKVVYLSHVQVTHFGSASLKRLQTIEFKMINLRALLRFKRKHASWPESLLWKLTISAGLIFVHLPLAIVREIGRHGSEPRLSPIRVWRYLGDILWA
jgi:N-acetylglucosaminyl-diphospho-decaprenol L-rhamnosyltransferase